MLNYYYNGKWNKLLNYSIKYSKIIFFYNINSLNIKLVEKHLTFFSIGTRIQLLENLAKALDQQLDVEKLSDGSEPETLEQNFPAIQEQSRHWSLNQEQNDAFILMAAALLQHINNTNQLNQQHHLNWNTFKGARREALNRGVDREI